MRLLALMAILLMPAAASAQSAAVPEGRPATFIGGAVAPLQANFLNTLPPLVRPIAALMHQACVDWSNAPTRAAQDEIERRVNQQLQERQRTNRELLLGGVLAEKTLRGNVASARVMITPSVSFSTAPVGMLASDIADTHIQRGGRVHQALADAAVGDIIMFNGQIIGAMFTIGQCHYLTRFRTFTVGR